MIISASRRCDIPRFRFDWFLQRLADGFVDVANPYNAAQVRRVPLRPSGAAAAASAPATAVVFWTRDPGPILLHLDDLETCGCRFYVMVTLTGYPPILEPNVPAGDTVIHDMKMLAHTLGANRVCWRYDPVLLTEKTDLLFHRENFADLARRLEGVVERVIISVYDEYAGAKRRLAALASGTPGSGTPGSGTLGSGTLGTRTLGTSDACRILPHYDDEGRLLPELRELLAFLARTAAAAGMEMQSCAEAEDLSAVGIKSGACIDGDLINKLWGIEATGKDKNQRHHCRCAASVDIGSYGPCPAGCVYCYARR
jgi:hypothetical protein